MRALPIAVIIIAVVGSSRLAPSESSEYSQVIEVPRVSPLLARPTALLIVAALDIE